ncbi:hypothetical protein [Dubosiella newyorkensis]|uniref:hypothetical protein n=1 Tax=Dubosiella newyorkensis TaxID=1862672 RepID=UPI00272A5BEA|nr:hypothetical protein [Dubosiella newyorkensis]
MKWIGQKFDLQTNRERDCIMKLSDTWKKKGYKNKFKVVEAMIGILIVFFFVDTRQGVDSLGDYHWS